MCLQIMYLEYIYIYIYIYIYDLSLNNLKWFICHKTQPELPTKYSLTNDICIKTGLRSNKCWWIVSDTMFEFVNSAVNSARIWLAVLRLCRYPPPLLLFKWDPQGNSLFFLYFADLSRRLCLTLSFCFVSSCLFAFVFWQFFLKQGGLSK